MSGVARTTGVPSDGRGPAGHAAAGLSLRILATTDLHAYLVPFDYFRDSPVDTYGLTRTAGLIASARAEVPNCLLFDNGDFLQGSAIGDYMARGRTRMPHPMIETFHHLGYDAGTLGNHEFNFGLPFLKRVLAEARHPIVSANVILRRGEAPLNDQHFVPPFTLLTRTFFDSENQPRDIKIGVIGLTPPQIVQWDRQHLDGKLLTRGMVETARAWVPRLRAAGADIVVVLAHTGISLPSAQPDLNEDCATDLAAIAGVDVVIAGHSHLAFPGPDYLVGPAIDPVAGRLWGKPAVLPGQFGSHLGVIDLVLHMDPRGRWQIAESTAHLRLASGAVDAPVSPAGAEMIRRLETAAIGVHRATRRWIRRDIGRTDHRLHSYFALVADSTALGVLAAAQTAAVRAALTGTSLAQTPVLSAVSAFKAGGRGGPANYVDIPAGPLALRHAADLCPFPNTLSALLISGAELADWLERSVSIYHQILPGTSGNPLINTDFASFQHDRIYGISYEIDLAAAPGYSANGSRLDPATRRIRRLQWQGRAIADSDTFVMATNSFRSGGAGCFLADAPSHIVLETRLQSRDMLARHILATGGIITAPAQAWRYLPMPGTDVWFDTASTAITCMHDAGGLDLTPVGQTETGFCRFRLRL